MEANETPTQTENKTSSKTWDQLTYGEREELKALSLAVYGASSRAKKLIEQGYYQLVTEETTEYVPGKTKEDGTEEGTTRKVNVPVLRKDGAKQSVLKRHTVDSIRAEMIDRKAKIEEIRAIMQRQKDEALAKKKQEELSKHVHEELAGSAT